MTRSPMILSVSLSGEAASDPVVAGQVAILADSAMIDLLLLGEGSKDAPAFDALVAAAWLAPRTRRVGLVPMSPALYAEPFHVARALSALDFLTAGRSGWQVTTLGEDAQARRYGLEARLAPDQALAKGADFVAAAKSLWDSWDSDALIIDQESGIYLDPKKVRRNDHRGPFFQVMGALNAARPPQGYPILVQSDEDPLHAAVAADVLLVASTSTAPANGARRLARVALTGPDAVSVDEIERRYKAGEIDGVHLLTTDPVADLTLFKANVLPELERRGLIDPGPEGATLRARFGLAVPTNPFQSA